jgi:hypothetical protein
VLRRARGKYVTSGKQISGEAIWKQGRAKYYNGDLDGGLYIDQGFLAALNLGIFPPDTRLIEIQHDWASVGKALLQAPIVQAHHIHMGWENPSYENGCIDHRESPRSSDGYHATVRIGRLVQDGRRFYLSQNSWGRSWGFHGCFCMTEAEDAEGLMPDGLYQAALPNDWEHWDGWVPYLVDAP